ncbi:MAG: hypothetical protein ABI670_14425 [Chloroflexota bacterium]
MITETRSAEQSETAVTSQTLLSGRAEIPLVIAFFVVLTVAMTWPWAAHMGESINPFGDVVLQMALLRWDAHALVTNPAGLFEAPFFYPYAHSVAFSEHLIGETLVALPFLLLTGNPALAYNLNVLLSFVLTGLFTYLLVRDLTGSRAAGLLSGVAFAFCPFRFMQMGHLHMLETAWLPFTLWALYRLTADGRRQTADQRSTQYAVRSSRTWIALALFGILAMGLSSVYYTFFLIMALMLAVVWFLAVALAKGEWRGWHVDRRAILWAVAGLVVVAAILLPVYLPYAQTSADLGVVRTTYELENWSAEWSYFGKVLQNNWLYAGVLAPGMATSLGERQLFFGIVPGLLALAGLIWGRGRERWYFALLGLFSLLMTFGLSRHIPGTDIVVPLPYAFFYDWLPGFKALRVPVRFAAMLDFSLYVLAGYGLAALLRRLAAPRVSQQQDVPRLRQRWPAIVAAVLIGLVLLEFANPLDAGNRRDVTAQVASTEPYGWLARPENAGVVLELPFNPDQADVQYMLFGTRHWQPILNGSSGFVPPGTVELSRAMAAFPDPATVSILQGLEVRHIVVHLWQYPKDQQASLKERLDTTEVLTMVNQAGDNYVYRLAPDPWLRELAHQMGSDKTVWVGEARHGSMPSLEVLAYALHNMGVRWEQMGGNINIGYRPLGQLPFGTFPDYALVPNDAKLSNAELLPVGLELDTEALQNPAVKVLHQSTAGMKSYDMARQGAPAVDIDNLALTIEQNGVTFSGTGKPSSHSPYPEPQANARSLDLYFVSFGASTALLSAGTHLLLPPGVSRYSTTPLSPGGVFTLGRMSGDMKLLRVVSPGQHEANTTFSMLNQLPLEVTPSKASATLDTRLRAIAPSGNGDLTATIDVYVEPWGTHPDGHFGSWSVVLPGDAVAHDYIFSLDPLAKTVTTIRDGQPVETFAWVGPPTQGDFHASLVVSDKSGTVANVPLYTFTLSSSRLTDWQLDAPSLSITPVR